VRVLLNGRSGKVGSDLGPALLAAGHELADIEAGAEAMVDFTSPGAAVGNVLRALDARLPCVVGTTGWDTDAVDAPARAARLPVFYAPNFSIGAVLMMRFAEEAAKHLEAAEIVELHHATKLDAPSGTAAATAARMGGKIQNHSVRLPGLVAHQEVLLGAAGQVLTIRHDVTSREAYAPGVLLALSKLHDLTPGLTVGLETLL
jgi:4-hydroxy-tetrahydrodipicolinate reductase